MVPVVVLAVIAVAIIRSLMSVVARDEVTTVAPWSPDYSTTTDPTVALRATTNDDVRAFLLPGRVGTGRRRAEHASDHAEARKTPR